MSQRNISDYRKRLDSLFDKGRALIGPKTSSLNEIELQAEWAKYLCVLVSGFLEVAVREIILQYVENKSSGNVIAYVSKELDGFLNPKMAKIVTLAEKFDKDWATQINDRATDEMKNAVNSIVSNRHQIAHGKSVGVSFSNISQWYKEVIKFVDLLAEICS